MYSRGEENCISAGIYEFILIPNLFLFFPPPVFQEAKSKSCAKLETTPEFRYFHFDHTMQNVKEILSDPETYESKAAASATEEKRSSSQGLLSQESRLSLPFAIRLPTATAIGFLSGASLGIGHGSKAAALRFRAENSHRLPTTPTGWYLYHKSKNYNTALGGVKEGARMGLRVSIWTAAFFTAENIFDKWRGEKDFLNTIGGGLAVAGGFSWWNSFPASTTARTAKISLVVGLSYGLVQDAVSFAKGRQLRYVNYVLAKLSKRT